MDRSPPAGGIIICHGKAPSFQKVKNVWGSISSKGGVRDLVALFHSAHYLHGLDAVEGLDPAVELEKYIPQGEGIGEPSVDVLGEFTGPQGLYRKFGELSEFPFFHGGFCGAQRQQHGKDGKGVQCQKKYGGLSPGATFVLFGVTHGPISFSNIRTANRGRGYRNPPQGS